jgi:hypothetical protein
MAKVWKAIYTEHNKPTKGDVGLGSVTNESKATMFANPAFTGTPSGITKSHVGLSNVADENRATILGGTFTGNIGGTSAADIKTGSASGVAAKSAVDGNSAVTMVGGSININSGEFVVATDGDCTIKGTLDIIKDSGDSSGLTMQSGGSGTMEILMEGANPTVDLGGTSPLGSGSLKLRRGAVGNQCRVMYYTDESLEFASGFSNQPTGNNTMWRMHHGSIYDNSSPYTPFDMSLDADGKIGFWSNDKTFPGITIGGDGTNSGLYIADGALVLDQNVVTWASTTTFNMATATNHIVTLTGNTTLAVSNLTNHLGQSGVIVLKQDATGGRTITLATEMKTPRGDSVSFETAANSTSLISYYIVSTSLVAINYMGNFS